jgi:hypothetical protein
MKGLRPFEDEPLEQVKEREEINRLMWMSIQDTNSASPFPIRWGFRDLRSLQCISMVCSSLDSLQAVGSIDLERLAFRTDVPSSQHSLLLRSLVVFFKKF